MDYTSYKEQISNDVSAQIEALRCQPALFLGSGISRRYFGAPNWEELLRKLADLCPTIDKDYAYYAQSCSSEPQIGSIFAEKFREWAWGNGKNSFPTELFKSDIPGDAYLKHFVARILKEATPDALAEIASEHQSEIKALQGIKPHAVLTTNYDVLLELIFPEYTKIVGQTALKGMPFAVGEVFKIHGCVNHIDEIILTSEDYEVFNQKKKFIAARLLSLFNEHPMLIAGYNAGDSNIKALLADIDEALALPGSLIENIYFLEFDPDAEKKENIPTEKLLQIADNRSVRVKLIVASDFEWVFSAFRSPESLKAVPASIMRAILARSYELVRSDVPRTTLEVDFDFLQQKLDNTDEFAKLFGITTVNDASALSAQFPHSITDLGKQLGGTTWHPADKAMKIVLRDTGVDLKAEDSKYVSKRRINKSEFRTYSQAALELLLKVQAAGECEQEWLE